MTKHPSFTFRIHPVDLQKLEKYSEVLGITRSEIVKTAIKKELKKYSKTLDQ